MKNLSRLAVTIISYSFAILFIYATISKILDFENFQVQIAQSPLLSAYAGMVSYGILVIELLTAGLLLLPKRRITGLYAAFALMTAFTAYIYLLLNYSDFIPCSCGGILEKLGWREHLAFNFGCIILAVPALIITEKSRPISTRTLIMRMTFVFSATGGLMVLLFLSSEHIIKKENNFTRRFLPHPISNEKAIDLKASSFYLAGSHGDTVFLGNREAPLLMATVLPAFKHPTIDTLRLSDDRFSFKKVELSVSYPFFSLTDGTVPVIFEGIFPDLIAKKVRMQPAYFSQIKMISAHEYMFKSTLTKGKKAILGYLNSETERTEIKDDFLEIQMDGLFDTDGHLSYDPVSDQMVYTYLYRNQYLTADERLLNKRSGLTIDTVTTARIKLHKMADGKTKMAAPPVEVNLFQTAFDHRLYNISALRGKFESLSRWKHSKIVDVYDLKDKSYQYSFYLKNRNDHSARDILVTKKHMYVLTGNELVRYQRRR